MASEEHPVGAGLRVRTRVLVALLALSALVQLFHAALLSSVLETAAHVAAPARGEILLDPEDEVGFAFIFGFGAELAAALLTGVAWLAWLAPNLRARGRTAGRLVVLHLIPVVQLVAPALALRALDDDGAVRHLRRAWTLAWGAALFSWASAAWIRPVLPLLRESWCVPRGLGEQGGFDWCCGVVETWIHGAGAAAMLLAAVLAIALVRRVSERTAAHLAQGGLP